MLYHCAVSLGEIIDKITILEIKNIHITDTKAKIHIKDELELLTKSVENEIDIFNQLKEELRMVNSNLWDVEDRLRECEKKKLFNQYFIELARSVYQLNDKRAAIKKTINLRSGSRLIEEKSYKKYD